LELILSLLSLVQPAVWEPPLAAPLVQVRQRQLALSVAPGWL